MTLPEALGWPERCSGCGYHVATMGCECAGTLKFSTSASPRSEWGVFVTAVRAAVCSRPLCERPGRHVHQDDVRPRIKGRIEPKHIGQLYRRAKSEGLLAFVGKEPSGDAEGRNTHHDSPVYELRSAA